MNPPKPQGTSAKARWQQWVHDSLAELVPRYGPGVLTDFTTRGTMRRMVPRKASIGSTCSLPVLRDSSFHFGLWYDSSGVLHLWNTTLVEHSGKRWARFTNPFVIPFLNTAIPYSYWGIAYDGADTKGSISSCLSNADIEAIRGPDVYSHNPGERFGGILILLLDLGQYFDMLIYPPKKNSGKFWHTTAFTPPGGNIVFASGLGYYVYDTGEPVRVPTPITLPY
jgi:hypothetical protein